MSEPVFKVYEQRQGMLLPPSYEELVPMNHPVRVVDVRWSNLTGHETLRRMGI